MSRMADFDVKNFVLRHLRVKSWKNYRNQIYSVSELETLIEMVVEKLKVDETLAKINPPCTIVGDVHGQYRDLLRILCSTGEKSNGLELLAKNRYVFLGDYVDRGQQSLECICLVFALKILFPSNYVLLRGNHETSSINFAYGFKDEIQNRLGEKDGENIWRKFNQAFNYLPLAGLVGERILCMHGGISPHLTSLDEIKKIQRPMPDISTHPLAVDLLWSDPMPSTNFNNIKDSPIFIRNVTRGLSCEFNEFAIANVIEKCGLELIVRAHQVQEQGFKFSQNRKMITVFSAPKYTMDLDNLGSVLIVQKSGKISLRCFKACEEGLNERASSSSKTESRSYSNN